MKHLKKKVAALLAAALLTVSLSDKLQTLHPGGAAAVRESVTAFAERVSEQMKEADNRMQFAEMRYSAAEQQVYCDGKAVDPGDLGYCVVDGEWMISAALTETAQQRNDHQEMDIFLSVEEAAERIGCTVEACGDDLILESPFQSGRLLVTSEQPVDQRNAVWAVDGYRDLSVLQFETAADAYAAYLQYESDPAIQSVEPDRLFTLAEQTDSAVQNMRFTETFPGGRWGIEATGAEEYCTWLKSERESLPEIVVAVLDTGIYADHAWFQGRIADGGRSFATDGINGVLNSDVQDDDGHGTACAGIICSMTCENVKILPIKCLYKAGLNSILTSSFRVFCSLMYAAEQHANVVSMSLGKAGKSLLVDKACKMLAEQNIICVAAAGNESLDVKMRNPANAESCIAVSAIAQKGYNEYQLASFSNFGSGIDFAAPGVMVESAGITDPAATQPFSGTSAAAPFTAACFADLLSYDPDMSWAEAYETLKENAIDLGEPGFDEQYGWGLVHLAGLFGMDVCAAPAADILAGSYSEPLSVSLSVKTADAEIYYTLDGSQPTAETGIRYTGLAIEIAKTTVLQAIAVSGDSVSRTFRAEYVITCDPPTAEPKGGKYDTAIQVKLNAANANAKIYYTTDGSLPTAETGTEYDGNAIAITNSTVLQAIAVIGSTESAVCRADYIINGQDTAHPFVVEDGVLLAYRGVLAEPDLSELEGLTAIGDRAFANQQNLRNIVLPDSVTSIGNAAFENCRSLSSLSAGSVTEIGEAAFSGCTQLYQLNIGTLHQIPAYAFYTCSRLNLNQIDFSETAEIGDYAFYNTQFAAKLTFSALRSLGSYAFAESNLNTISLPSEITVLPEGVFQACTKLKSVSAAGITRIEAYALAQINGAPETDIDFSAVTEIGDYACSGLQFTDAVDFSALTSIGKNAFYQASADTLSFPQLKEIPAEAFHDVDARILYFEQVKSVADNAFSGGTYNMPGIVFGSELSAIADNAVSNSDFPAFLAAPQDSVVRQYAETNGYLFRETPDIYFPKTTMTLPQFSVQAVDAYPLGFDMTLEWYQQQDEALSPFAQGNHVTVTAVQPADMVYRVLAKTGDRTAASADLTVHVTPEPADEQPMYADTPALIDWQTVAGKQTVYRFTPETDGSYKVFAAANNVSDAKGKKEYAVTVSVLHASAMLWSGSGNNIIPMQMQAGESYFIKVERSDYADVAGADRYSMLTISQTPSKKSLNSYVEVMPEQRAYVHTGETVRPACTVFRKTQQLEQDTDYCIYYGENTEPGTGYIYVFGIGAYTGLYVYQFPVVRVVQQTDASNTVFNLTDEMQYFQFQPVESAAYTIYISSSLEAVRNAKPIGDNIKDILSVSAQLELYDSDLELITSAQCEEYVYAWLKADLQADTIYYIGVQSNDGTVNTLDLNVTARQTLLNASYISMELPESLEFNCQKQEPVPDIRIDSVELTAGTDYELYYFNNLAPGNMTVVAAGIGNYCGILFRQVEILTDFYDLMGDAVQIACDKPFQMTGQYGLYRLSVKEDCKFRFQAADAQHAPFHVAIYYNMKFLLPDYDVPWDEYVAFDGDAPNLEQRWNLGTGEYYIAISQNRAADRSFVIQTENSISDLQYADVFAEDAAYTGEAIHPVVHVQYHGKTLVENQDFKLLYREDYITCGMHKITLEGIGQYAGYAHAYFNIRSDSDVQAELLTEGSHLAVIEQEGQTVYYRWKPEHKTYCFVKEGPGNGGIAVFNADMQKIGSCEGYDLRYSEITVEAGKTYTVTVSYTAKEQTGSIPFRVTSDYTMLSACTIDGIDAIPYPAHTEIPAYTVRDGDTLLTAGVDYAVQHTYIPDSYGEAYIILSGMGRYIGTAVYQYCIYPENRMDVESEPIALELDMPYLQRFADSNDDTQHFRFTSEREADTTYYLLLPDAKRDGIRSFVYDSNGVMQPLNAAGITLAQGESVDIFCIAGRIEEYHCSVSYSVGITDSVYYYDAESGVQYRIENGKAFVHSFDADVVGLQIPDVVVNPANGISGVFSGIAMSDSESFRQNYTIYGENGGLVDAYCREHTLCFADIDPQSTVPGDISGDGLVTADDARTLLRWLTECRGMRMSELAYAAADCNGDGDVNLLDVLAILEICTQNMAE